VGHSLRPDGCPKKFIITAQRDYAKVSLEAQRRPSALLRTMSLSNGVSNGRWTFYFAVTAGGLIAMLPRQKVAMIIICLFIFILVLDLVRRRKLREEYSWLWLVTSLCLFLLVIKYSWLEAVSKTIGAVLPTTTLFMGALIFLLILSVQFSVRISRLTDQVKNLVQENALLKDKMEKMGGDS
jgi:hypothetical protein